MLFLLLNSCAFLGIQLRSLCACPSEFVVFFLQTSCALFVLSSAIQLCSFCACALEFVVWFVVNQLCFFCAPFCDSVALPLRLPLGVCGFFLQTSCALFVLFLCALDCGFCSTTLKARASWVSKELGSLWFGLRLSLGVCGFFFLQTSCALFVLSSAIQLCFFCACALEFVVWFVVNQLCFFVLRFAIQLCDFLRLPLEFVAFFCQPVVHFLCFLCSKTDFQARAKAQKTHK